MLSFMKSVKKLGLSEPLSVIIENLRMEEIKSSTRLCTLHIIMIILGKTFPRNFLTCVLFVL
jgi:hypothetical protein